MSLSAKIVDSESYLSQIQNLLSELKTIDDYELDCLCKDDNVEVLSEYGEEDKEDPCQNKEYIARYLF